MGTADKIGRRTHDATGYFMSDEEAARIIARAVAKAEAVLGKPCRFHVTMRELRRVDAQGWWGVGTVGLKDESQAWDVLWHPERQQGWLWAFIMLKPFGVTPRRFDPPD